jgi:AmmeMemoRadiSam system protein B
MVLSSPRRAVVAGQFYPGSEDSLTKMLQTLIPAGAKKQEAVACMLPHAGYMYSGRVAGETIAEVRIKEKIILLGPNHTGYGSPFSIMTRGSWETPLGKVEIDASLAGELLKNSEYLSDDRNAHEQEHSIEVELPFLQYLKSSFEIVPMAFMSDDIKALKCIGEEIGRLINEKKMQKEVLIVASSDMTHYEPQKETEEKDRQAINAILELDADRLMKKIKELDVTMCGYAPAIVMISAAKALGAKKGRLIKYQTSGETTQDFESVVGYAGIIIE